MSKYVLAAFWGIFFIIATILLVRYVKPKDTKSTKETATIASGDVQANFDDSIEQLDIVIVTVGDSLYHAPFCSWIGEESQRMSMNKAKALRFYPCSQCIEVGK